MIGELRAILANKIQRNSGSNLEDILFAMVFELLPVCFLEGLDQLDGGSRSNSLGRSIQNLFFTSNSFDEDDVFQAVGSDPN